MPKRVTDFKKLWQLMHGGLELDEAEALLKQLEAEGMPAPSQLMEKIMKGAPPNTHAYNTLMDEMQWNPEMSGTDFTMMSTSMHPALNPGDQDMAHYLWDKYKVPTDRDLRLMRGQSLPFSDFPEGFQIDQNTLASTSMNPKMAKYYAARLPSDRHPHKVFFDIDAPKGLEVLPRPGMYQDEFMMPPGSIFEVSGPTSIVRPKFPQEVLDEGLFKVEDVFKVPVRVRKRTEWGKGGPVQGYANKGIVKKYKFQDFWDLAAQTMDPAQRKQMLNELEAEGQPLPWKLAGDLQYGPSDPVFTNTPKYTRHTEAWNPEMTGQEFSSMSDVFFPYMKPEHHDWLYNLWSQYHMPLERKSKLFRSVNLPFEVPPGFQVSNETMSSASMSQDIGKLYAQPFPGKPMKPMMFEIDTPKDTLLMPRPNVFHSEFLLPPDSILEVTGKPDKVRPYSKLPGVPDVTKIPAQLRRKREFAAGGPVDYSHYGQGPEHEFFGADRFGPLPAPTPQASPAPVKASTSSGGSGLGTLGTIAGVAGLGYAGKKLYDKYFPGTTPEWIKSITDNPVVDKLKDIWKGGKGAANLYIGTQQGGVGGAGTALSGAGDLAKLGEKYDLGTGKYGSYLSGAGDVLSGIDQGGVKGALKAGSGALNIANAAGVGTGALGSYVPVVGGLYNLTQANFKDPGSVTGALGSAATAASPLATGATAGVLGSLSTAMPLAAAGFAIADLANAQLNKHDVEYQTYAQNMGFTPIKVGEGRKGAKGQVFGQETYYVMDNGKIISPKDMEWLARQSRPTGRGDEGVDAAYRQKVQDLRAADWRSPHINQKSYDTIQKWISQQADPSKYHIARGGAVNKAEGGPMRGALSRFASQMPQRQEDPSSYYSYGAPPQRQASVLRPPQLSPLQRAMGGGANFGYNQGGDPNLVHGPGTGRSDDIPARLSDGEYVWDAETVALLGDGSTDEGARRLDALRKKLRMHKGKQLAKGKFSSKAKLPEQYLE